MCNFSARPGFRVNAYLNSRGIAHFSRLRPCLSVQLCSPCQRASIDERYTKVVRVIHPVHYPAGVRIGDPSYPEDTCSRVVLPADWRRWQSGEAFADQLCGFGVTHGALRAIQNDNNHALTIARRGNRN